MNTTHVVELDTSLRRLIVTGLDPAIARIITAIARASAGLADRLSRLALADTGDQAGQRIDAVAHDRLVESLAQARVHSVLSEFAYAPVALDPSAAFAVTIDPLEGWRNLASNAPLGTIFSVVAATHLDGPPDGRSDGIAGCAAADFLQSGRSLRAAGFVMYGPATVMALTVGTGTQLFVFDRAHGGFVRSCTNAQIPIGTREFAINASNYRHWDAPLRNYIDDLVAGAEGPRGEDFTMRWTAALVSEAYHILVHGGIFLSPADARDGHTHGQVRLITQARPIAFVMEQAGGAAVDMTGPVLDRRPLDVHEYSPLVFGSHDKVDRVAHYDGDSPFSGERSPLFAHRGLFRL